MAGLFDDLLPGAAPAGSGLFDDLVPAAKPKAPLPERSKLAAINDTVIDAANAVAGGVGSVADFVSPGNPVSSFIDENIIKPGQEKQSDRKKAINAQLAEDIANADGLTGEAAAAVRYALADPAGVLAQAAGSFVVPGGAIKGAGMLARFGGAGAKGVSRAGLAGGVAAGAALSGGDAAGQAYEESKAAGATEEQAQAAGRQASVIPAIVGGAGGMLGAERLLAGGRGFAGGAASRAVKTGLSEGVQEGLEEGVTQYEANRAVAPFDGRDPMKGVGAAATLGAVMGAPIGGVTGALSRNDAPALLPALEPAPAPAVDPVLPILSAGSVDDAIKAATEATSGKATGGGLDRLRGILPDEQRREVIGLMATANNPNSPPNVRRFAEQQIDAILREYTDIPTADVVEETDLLPTADATELTDEQRAAYVNTPGFVDRYRMSRGIPVGEATEAIPTGDAAEVEPIPAGDASEEIPAPEAFEQLPVGETADLIPTGEATEAPAKIPTGKATEIEPEVIDGDLLTGDGMPYGSKTAANVRAKREGLGPANVVEIPGAGWVVRPQPTTLGRAGINAQPAGTRGTTAADILKAPDGPNPARTAGPRPADGGRGDGAAVLPVQQPADVVDGAAAPAGQGVDGGGAAGPGAGGRDEALTPKVGELVKLTKPGMNGPVNIAGTVNAILPDGRLEIKTQQDGYLKRLPSELGHKPKSTPNAAAPAEQAPAQARVPEAAAPAPTLADKIKQRRAEKAADPEPVNAPAPAEGGALRSVAPDTKQPGAGAPNVDALRDELRKVENAILSAAPAKFTSGGGNIEAAMKRREVPTELKQRRTALKDQIRAAAAPSITPTAQAVKDKLAATHKDPGEPADPATAPVIAAALGKAAKKEALSRAAMKAEALRLVDAAIATAKDEDDADVRMYAATAPGTKMTEAQIAEYKRLGSGQPRDKYMKRLAEELAAQHERAAQNIGFASIKVPGDGTFKVLNTKARLADFRKKVEASPGFKEARAPRAPGNVSNSKADAFSAMVEDGDLHAALDYAQAVGIDPKTAKLTDVLRKRLDKFMRDEEMAAAVAARAPAAPAPDPQPEVDAAPAAEPVAEAPAPAPARDEKTIELRKRLSVLRSLKDCMA